MEGEVRSVSMVGQMPPYVSALEQGMYRLYVWVQPGAKKSEACGIYQNYLKIRVQAPAEKNRANRAALDLLAKLLGVKHNRLEMENGQTGRRKSVLLNSSQEPDWAAIMAQFGQ